MADIPHKPSSSSSSEASHTNEPQAEQGLAPLSRRQTLAGLGLGLGTATVFAALPAAARAAISTSPISAKQAEAEGFLDSVAWALYEHQPGRATALGVDVEERAYLRGRTGDSTLAGQQALAGSLREQRERIKAYDLTGVDDTTRTSFAVVDSAYRTALDGFAFPYGDVAIGSYRNAPYVVIQNVGAYIDTPRGLDASQPITSFADMTYWLERVKAVPEVLNGELERMTKARDLGVVPPDFLLDKAIMQMEATIAAARSGELYVPSFRERASKLIKTTKQANEVEAIALEADRFTRGEIAGDLTLQLNELKQERAVAKSAPGMWAQPEGDEWYRWALRASTTTNLTPDEVHEQGLEELAALHARMDPILQKIGYTSGTVGERMTALSEDKRYKFAPGDPGRAEIMAFINERIDWIRGQMPRAFNTLVPGKVEVRRLPLAEEPGAPGAYGGAGSKDGTIPARMWINLRTTDLHRKYDLADLTYHEAIPGHAWEGEYSNALPMIRASLAFNAFSEGWALYAEQLADELGAYDDFEVGRLGYLQSLAFRACRMVVDTGLHARKWSRQRAVDFFVQRNGSKEQEVASEVDRYCSWPGQACGYKVGHSQVVRLRDKAKTALGSAYDLRAFNDAVVIGGNAPLDVLAVNVDRYIANPTKKPSLN